MTELRYDAPLATFDGDEWSEFLDDDDDDDENVDVENCSSGRARNCPGSGVQYADSPSDRRPTDLLGSPGPGTAAAGDGFGDDEFSGSLEDLVSCFDENVRQCFRNYSADTEFIAPVQIRTHEQVLHESQ